MADQNQTQDQQTLQPVQSPTRDISKYFDIAANAAITAQAIAKDAPGETKMQLALNIVNAGLGFAATVNPQLTPVLALAAGTASPIASLITGFVQLFKAHGLHGFAPSKTPATQAATA